jgi:hypothetical protein
MRVSYVARAWSASLAVLLFGQACGASKATVTASPEMPIWREEGDVAIGVETVSEGSREHTVVGVRLLVVNRASRPVSLRRDRIVLELPDGGRLSPAGSAAAAGPPPQYAGGAGVAQLCVMLPLCAVAGALLVVMLASEASRPAAEAAYEARLQEYEAKSFPAVAELDTEQRAHGFVFFRLSEAGATSTTGPPEVARGGAFAEESRRIADYTSPPPALRAVVANMAGTRTFALHLEIEDGEGVPTSGSRPRIAHFRVPLSR